MAPATPSVWDGIDTVRAELVAAHPLFLCRFILVLIQRVLPMQNRT